MMQSINSIYAKNTAILKKTVASIKAEKLSFVDSRRAKILKMMANGACITVGMASTKTKSARTTINGDLNFLLKSGAIKARTNQNPLPGKGFPGREFYIPTN